MIESVSCYNRGAPTYSGLRYHGASRRDAHGADVFRSLGNDSFLGDRSVAITFQVRWRV